MGWDPNALTDRRLSVRSAIEAHAPQHFYPLDDETDDTVIVDAGSYPAAGVRVGAPTPNAESSFGARGMSFDGLADYLTIASPSASTTTFTVIAAVRPSKLATDAGGTVLRQSSNGHGLAWDHTNKRFYFATTGGDNRPNGHTLAFGTEALVCLSVTAGTPTWVVDGVAYSATGTAASLAAFTPNRMGGLSAASSRLCGDLALVTYLPGIALTSAQLVALYAARVTCLTAVTEVANRALAALRVNKQITALDTSASAEAAQVRLHYHTVVQGLLRSFIWPFATRYQMLTLIDGSETAPANNDWTYAYRLPSDCLRVRRLVREGFQRRFDPRPPPYRTGSDATGLVLYTNMEDAEIEYTKRPVCAALSGDDLFLDALAYRLGAAIGPAIVKDKKVVDDCVRMFAITVNDAGIIANNEQERQSRGDDDAEWIRARGTVAPAREDDWL